MSSRGSQRIPDGAPCPLPPGDRAWLVREGRVEAYLVSPSRRRLVAIVEAGGHVFSPPPGAELSLVAPGGAVIEPAREDAAGALAASAAAWMGQAGSAVGLAPGDTDLAAPTSAVLQRFMQAVHAAHEAADAQRDAADLARLAQRSAQPGAGGPAEGRLQQALATAAAAVGADQGRRVRVHASEDFSAIPQLARALGFRARRVRLPADWFRSDLGPLIVRDAEDETAEALVWRRGRYQDAAGHEIGEAAAARFGAMAYIAYPPLPADVKGFTALGRFVLAGQGAAFGQVLAAALAIALVGLVAPIATTWIFQDIVPAGEGGLLAAVGLALAISALTQALLGGARGLAQARIEGPSAVRLAAGLTDRLLRLPARFFRNYSAGDLGQRIQAVETMRSLVVGVVLSTGLAALFSVVYLALLFVYDARLAALALGIVLLYAATLFITRLAQIGPLREAAAIEGRIAGVTNETLEAVAKLRTAAAEDRALARWRALYVREQQAAVKGDRIGARFGAFADGWQILTLAGLFGVAALLSRDTRSAGAFIGFLTAYAIFQASFVAFCEAMLRLMTAQPLAERASVLLAAEPEGDAGRADPGRLTGLIEVSGVSFGYVGDGPPLLSQLSFTLRPGEHVAIVGGSGSGKSTVLRLLLGFETPRTGAVFYDGQDLAALDPARVRQQIGVVLQSSRLFAGSILENIRGANELALEACLRAAERAGLTPDLALLPMGVHTPITDGAGGLSGGQRQRILIARAIAGDPRILFLDEATSALDNVTQAVVAQAIDSLDIARVTIAHRLSTVRNADRICVLSGGRFVETGPYDELFARGGVFTELAKRQLLGD